MLLDQKHIKMINPGQQPWTQESACTFTWLRVTILELIWYLPLWKKMNHPNGQPRESILKRKLKMMNHNNGNTTLRKVPYVQLQIHPSPLLLIKDGSGLPTLNQKVKRRLRSSLPRYKDSSLMRKNQPLQQSLMELKMRSLFGASPNNGHGPKLPAVRSLTTHQEVNLESNTAEPIVLRNTNQKLNKSDTNLTYLILLFKIN